MGDGADQDDVARELARTYGVPAVRRPHFERVDARLAQMIPARLARKHQVVPVGLTRGELQELVVAMRDPSDVAAIDELGFQTGARIRPAVADPALIDEFLDTLYGPEPRIELPAPAVAPAPAADPRFAPRAEADAPLELGVELPPRSAPPPMIAPPALAPPRARVVSSPPPTAPSGNTMWARLGASLIGVLVGGWLFHRCACNSAPDPVDVGGKPFYAEHIGMDVVLPPGWFYVPAEDRTQSGGGVEQKTSMFFRGGTVDEPEHALAVATADTKGVLPSPIPPAMFEKMLRGMQLGASGSSGGFTTRLRDCRVSNVRPEQNGECDGSAVYRGLEWAAKVYLWIDPAGKVCVAGYLSREPLENVQLEIAEILTNLQFRR